MIERTAYLYRGLSLQVEAEVHTSERVLPGWSSGGTPGAGSRPRTNPGRGESSQAESRFGGFGGYAPSQTNAREYLLARGQIVSHTDVEGRWAQRNATAWYVTDVRGSTIALMGRHGNTEASYNYDAYGVVYGRGAAERQIAAIPGRPTAFKRGTDYLYAGKRHDAATGLYDYGFRDYAPRLARFTSVDPIKDGRNWYAYVGADPVNRFDWLGLAAVEDGLLTFAPGQLSAFTEYGYQEDTRRMVEKRELARFTRELEMYQPGGGGPYGNPGTYCNQSCYDYTAATSPDLFEVMTGGTDRTNVDRPVDRSYNVNANMAAENLAKAAALAAQVQESPVVAAAIEAGGTQTTIVEVDGEEADALADEGYTVVAVWKNPSGQSGHMGIVVPANGEYNPSVGPDVSDVGASPGRIQPATRAFPRGAPRYYYDTDQDLNYIDYSQLNNASENQ